MWIVETEDGGEINQAHEVEGAQSLFTFWSRKVPEVAVKIVNLSQVSF